MQLAIQILQYEFLGPIKLSEWGPPMDRVVYIIFSKNKDVFNMIYVAESDKTEARDFFTKNDQFKCWLSYAGKEENLYLSIYPMWESSQPERTQLVKKIIADTSQFVTNLMRILKTHQPAQPKQLSQNQSQNQSQSRINFCFLF